MKSLKELIAGNIVASERELNAEEASVLLAILYSIQSDVSKYEVRDNRLKHITKETDGLVIREYINGRVFKETRMFQSGSKRFETYYKHDKIHREGAPARIEWYSNGQKANEFWLQDGHSHRDDGPASLGWYENGNKKYAFWYKNGKIHREDGPATIAWHENGNKRFETWYKDDMWGERENGLPYYTQWDENGEIVRQYA